MKGDAGPGALDDLLADSVIVLINVLPGAAFARLVSGAAAAATFRVRVLPVAGFGVGLPSHHAGGLAVLLAHLA